MKSAFQIYKYLWKFLLSFDVFFIFFLFSYFVQRTCDRYAFIIRNMGVFQRGFYVGMTQHIMDIAQIGSIFEQMGGRRMPKPVICNLFTDACFEKRFFQYIPHTYLTVFAP